MDDDPEAAWAELHDDNERLGWIICPTTYEPRLEVSWSIYAFDPRETPKVGHRSREWTATAMTEAACVREMARCLREIGEGRVPKWEPTGSYALAGARPRKTSHRRATALQSRIKATTVV